MSDKAPKDQSTTLHLGKFAPSRSSDTEEQTGSATICVKRAAAQTVEQVGQVTMPKDAGDLPPKEMLGAVSYCYAKGVYSSEEIEERMLRDSRLRESVHGEVPRAEAIRRFRSLNRDAIRATLEKAFRFMRKRRAPMDAATPALTGVPPHEATTITTVRREASERLDQAAFIDNMSKE